MRKRYYLLVKMNKRTHEKVFCNDEIYTTKAMVEQAVSKYNRLNLNDEYEYGWTNIFLDSNL